MQSRIYYNRFVVVYCLLNTKPGRYDEFRDVPKRLGMAYTFAPNWFLLKAQHSLEQVTQRLREAIDTADGLLVLELEHGKRPTRIAVEPANVAEHGKGFLETF